MEVGELPRATSRLAPGTARCLRHPPDPQPGSGKRGPWGLPARSTRALGKFTLLCCARIPPVSAPARRRAQ